MSRIKELLTSMEIKSENIKSLAEIANISTGQQLNRNSLSESGDYPVLNGGVKPSGFHPEFNTPRNTIAISQGGASAGHVSFMSVDFWAGAHCYVVSPKDQTVSNKYLYYLLKNSQNAIQASKLGAGIPGLSRSALAAVKVPIPEIALQHEIVRILDTFTELEAVLEAELEARKKQYEYYRNQLLTFEKQGGVRWVPMVEVAKIRNGSDWKTLPGGDIPVYGSGGQMGSVGTSVYDGPSVLIPRKGSLGNLFYLNEPFWTVDTCFYTEIDAATCLPKFLYYFLKIQDLAALNLAGGVPSLTQTQLNRILVPTPTIERQAEIVEILDKFDALVSDLSIGLPAELKARRQQYEYYRNQLLTFKEIDAA